MGIVVKNVNKNFGTFQALNDINLEFKQDKLVALLGPSGSGKSTLLRAIAGLETPDTGSIVINGKDTTHLDIRHRNIGFVFQHYALFKHLTIRQNIAFGLEIRKSSPSQVKNRVEELLQLIQLEGLGNRYPSQLSGGQRQRVALARALAVQPQVLLLDEPFGALDAKVRKELRTWLRKLHEEVHITSIFVTHDQEEAMEVADEIVVMNQGKVEQVGTATEIYDHPTSPFVMSFVGEVNVLPFHFCQKHLAQEQFQSSEVEVFVRPHDIEIDNIASGVGTWAIVQRIINLGWTLHLELELPDHVKILVQTTRQQLVKLNLFLGTKVFIRVKNPKLFPLPSLQLSAS